MKNIPFVLPVKTALGHYIYEVNKNEILFVDENIFQCVTSELLNKSDEAVEEQLAELKLNGYLSSHKIKHIQHSLSEISKILLDRGINQLILQVTQECNLRCKYCIYSENSNVNQRMHTNSFMTLETAKKAIDFYRIHSIDADRAVIGFYGGEPFLNFDLIKKAVEYAEIVFEGKEIVFTATSNATLLSDQIIEFIMQHLQTVASYACICSSECLTCGRCNAQYALLVQLRDNAVSETINNPIVDLQLLLKP